MDDLACFAVALALPIVGSGVAVASPPTITEDSFESESVLTDFCGGGVDVAFAAVIETKTIEFSDDEGNATRRIVQVDATIQLSNSDSDETFTDNWRYMVELDFVNGTRSFNGTFGRINVIGEGVPFLDTGRLILTFGFPSDELFSAGPTEEETSLDFACNYEG